MALNDEILDRIIAHQIWTQRYSTATVRKVIALLNRADKRIVDRLATQMLSELSVERSNKLLDAIRTIVAGAYGVAIEGLTSELSSFGAYETGFQNNLLRQALPDTFETVRPSASQVVAATKARPFQGRLLREWGKDLQDSAFKRVRDTIRMGMVEGRTTDQIVRDIRGTKARNYEDGILQRNRREMESVVRTAVNHTANVAREETYKANADIIKGVRWVATLDSRTTTICASRDGKVYPVDNGPRPPAHFGCRSTTAPVTKSWREMGFDVDDLPAGTRASMNGQAPADLTYNEWLRKQSVETQEEVLGVTKARLFRRGNMPIDRFVDKTGAEYTLDDLRQRDAAAFVRAGL
ncbi:phage head morphogenesis protein [Aureimonas fodinaquatilis]|uniref:Phage head morphogenesis protein n=1 Tax=Aureimonas fodinaquatilis TaxID=2565783 RepID=A0A5B0DWV7_9HYPH|nr:minor capsid protein [Aureimonas fodinaquatilis]KAA0970301.1 phage head morphogenesis protein [Aureimonas fodinaquatilis]